MNGIEKITSRIADDTQREIDKINAETSAACAEISERCDKAAQDEYWRLFKKGTAEATLRLERLNSGAELDAKKQILGEKQALVGDAFDAAVKKLCTLPEDAYTELLVTLAVQASSTGNEEIILNKSDSAKYGARVCAGANARLGEKGKLTLSSTTRDIAGGLVLNAGSIEMNCALDVLVGSLKDELSGPVAKILFD